MFEEVLSEDEDFKNKYKIIINNLFKLVINDKNSDETMEFIKGFNSIINPSILKDISINDLNLLIAGNNNINVDFFR